MKPLKEMDRIDLEWYVISTDEQTEMERYYEALECVCNDGSGRACTSQKHPFRKQGDAA